MENHSMVKVMVTILFVVAALATTARGNSHNDGEVPFSKCGKETFFGIDRRGFIRNVDEVLFELRTETPLDGNFDGRAERTRGASVFGRASCFSSLTTNAEGCRKCLDKAVKAVKRNCRNSLRASAGTAAAGCSLSYSNVKV